MGWREGAGVGRYHAKRLAEGCAEYMKAVPLPPAPLTASGLVLLFGVDLRHLMEDSSIQG